jgi:GcrA cell cycle regulator
MGDQHDASEPARTSSQLSQLDGADWFGERGHLPPGLGGSDKGILGFTLEGRPIARGEIPPRRSNLGGYHKNDWSAERTELLKKYWAQGYSATAIAIELGGVTRNAVIGKQYRLGLLREGKHATHTIRDQRAKPRRLPRMRTMPQEPVIDPVAAVAAPARIDVPQTVGATVSARRGIPLFDLRPHHCRWPMWDDAQHHAEHLFCGATKQDGSSFCPKHFRRAYTTARPR